MNDNVQSMNGWCELCGSVPYNYMTNAQEAKEELKLRIMRILEKNQEVSQRELSAELGVSLGRVNYCINALVDMGWVKLGNFALSDKKLGYLYILTPNGLTEKAAITTRFLKRKLIEYELLKKEIEELQIEAHH